MRKQLSSTMTLMVILTLILAACGNGGGGSPSPTAATTDSPGETAAESPDETQGEEPTGFARCGDENAGDALKIGGITDVGQLEDKSFNEAGWCGTIAGADSVGGSAQVIVTESPDDYSANIQQMIDEDFDVIVTYGFALGTDTAIAAKENPEVQFIGLDQSVCVDENGDPDPTFTCAGDAAELLPNYQGLIFREAQAGYLAGIIAGSITESDVVGTIGGIESIPAVKDYIGGYHNGVLSVNPDAEVLISYVSTQIENAFNDPAAGAALAEQMIQADADVIFQVAGLSGQGALEAACDADVFGIGVDVDQAESLPQLAGCIVTSAEKKIINAIQQAIERVANDEVVGGNVLNDASNDGIGLAPYHEFESLISADVQAMVDEAFAAFAGGSLDPCEGDGACFGE